MDSLVDPTLLGPKHDSPTPLFEIDNISGEKWLTSLSGNKTVRLESKAQSVPHMAVLSKIMVPNTSMAVLFEYYKRKVYKYKYNNKLTAMMSSWNEEFIDISWSTVGIIWFIFI